MGNSTLTMCWSFCCLLAEAHRDASQAKGFAKVQGEGWYPQDAQHCCKILGRRCPMEQSFENREGSFEKTEVPQDRQRRVVVGRMDSKFFEFKPFLRRNNSKTKFSWYWQPPHCLLWFESVVARILLSWRNLIRHWLSCGATTVSTLFVGGSAIQLN